MILLFILPTGLKIILEHMHVCVCMRVCVCMHSILKYTCALNLGTRIQATAGPM